MAASVAARREASLPYTELLQIHECLRTEVNKLYGLVERLASSSGEQWPHALEQLLRHFDFFYVVYHSHSRAEDEVILPALFAKGLAPEADKEIRAEHHGQHLGFERLRVILAALRSDPASGGERGAHLRDLSELVDSIRSSVWLHLKKEEEELFPLLTQHLDEAELALLSGHILGNRSSELVASYLQMIVRDLPPEEKAKAVQSMMKSAEGTHFARWLQHLERGSGPQALQQGGGAMVGHKVDSLRGAAASYHACASADCCKPPAQGTTLGCAHYRRRCKLFFECCQELFTCRMCHDEAVTCRAQSASSGVRWHAADRYSVKMMWCMECHTLGPTARHCSGCNKEMARYVCTICNLLDDADSRNIYHCPYCNICRLGSGLGKDFFHCMKCNACISTKLKDHACMDHSLEVDCAICLEGLFDATQPVQRLQCGHFMHRQCYDRYISTNFRCPTCRKSICDMQRVWLRYDEMWAHLRSQDEAISASSKSGSGTRRLPLRCHDCQAETVFERPVYTPVYDLPNKCSACGSYNTTAEPSTT